MSPSEDVRKIMPERLDANMYGPIREVLIDLRDAIRELSFDKKHEEERAMLVVQELRDLKKVQVEQTSQLIGALQGRLPEGSIDLDSHRQIVKTLVWAAIFLALSIAGINKIPDPIIKTIQTAPSP